MFWFLVSSNRRLRLDQQDALAHEALDVLADHRCSYLDSGPHAATTKDRHTLIGEPRRRVEGA
jgi:hypothetical protein